MPAGTMTMRYAAIILLSTTRLLSLLNTGTTVGTARLMTMGPTNRRVPNCN